jgi:RNA 2',3'-cyclic 3'-phosphodiesterase
MRLFIATTFPAAVLAALNERVAAIKSKLPGASWVRPETQHLTFEFLGEQDEAVVERIRIDGGASFEASLHGCGFFPNARQPRVGWVGVEPKERFVALAQSVRDAVRAAGLETDKKAFKPHLTLMRLRDRWPAPAVELFEKTLGGYQSAQFTVDRVTLYSSKLSPKGATHTALRTFALT